MSNTGSHYVTFKSGAKIQTFIICCAILYVNLYKFNKQRILISRS